MRLRRIYSISPELLQLNLPRIPKSIYIAPSALIHLSASSLKLNINPAQSLRIIRLFCSKTWIQFKCTNDPKLYFQLINFLKNFFLNSHLNKEAVETRNFSYFIDTHFLFHTIFPTNDNSLVSVYNSSLYDLNVIHFIRTQRRYNKRRYARVRAVSRPSFWAGMLTSTICVGVFWGATLQGTDWISTQIIITDINPIFFFVYTIIFIRIAKLWLKKEFMSSREINKQRRGIKYYTLKIIKKCSL